MMAGYGWIMITHVVFHRVGNQRKPYPYTKTTKSVQSAYLRSSIIKQKQLRNPARDTAKQPSSMFVSMIVVSKVSTVKSYRFLLSYNSTVTPG